MPSLNNFLLQALLEKGQLCLQNNSMDANNFVAMMNELALEVFLENVSKADLLNEAQMKHIKRYSTINKPEPLSRSQCQHLSRSQCQHLRQQSSSLKPKRENVTFLMRFVVWYGTSTSMKRSENTLVFVVSP